MRVVQITALAIALFAAVLFINSCDKERIVESTERVTEYIQLPPDTVTVTVTVFDTDTVFQTDSIYMNSTDTVRIHDTIRTTVTVIVHDTVVTVQHHYDTTIVLDTVVQIVNHYDTTVVTDTILRTQCNPSAITAIGAMASKTDPMVIDFINQEFGFDDGWVLYLSPEMMDVTQVSTNVYDIYGYIDYWTPDWSGFYPFEMGWRLTYISGDPANPNSWQMVEPPSTTSSHQNGLKRVNRSVPIQQIQR